MKKCIAVDWLQLHVEVPFRQYEKTATPYKIEKLNRGLKNFKSIYEISNDVEVFATLVTEPYSTMCMKESAGLLKIHNKYLYQKELYPFVVKLLEDLKLKFVNVTRLDIAMDFLKFDDMSVKDFIQGFASTEYLKKEKIDFKLHGDSWSVDKGKLTGGYETVKFGRETSDITYYLYNKSLEMNSVKMKPYIIDHWKAHGYDGLEDVYRLEFSLHPTKKAIGFMNDETGEKIGEVTFKDLDILTVIDHVFRTYYNRCFQFVYKEFSNRGNVRKQSRSADLVLFTDLKMYPVLIDISQKKESNRSTKIFLKKLKQLNDELRGYDRDLGIVGNEMFTFVAAQTDLKEWAKNKLGVSDYSFDEEILLKEKRRRNQGWLNSDIEAMSRLMKLHQLQFNF